MMKLILLLIGLMLLMGTASATDYYLSPSGDDSNDGLSIAQAKYNLSNMDDLTAPGVTVYCLNGSYYDTGTFIIRTVFNNGGNLTHGVKIIAYNGTPEFYGADSGIFIQLGSSGDAGLVENVTFDGISFRNYSKIMDARKIGNFTMSNCTLYNVGYPQDSAQLGGYNSQYITFNGNIIKGYIGYNSINFIGTGSYYYIYDNVIQDVNNTANHGAMQFGINLSHVWIYNNTMTNVPRSGGIVLYNGQAYWSTSDYQIYDNTITSNSNGFALNNAYNISVWNYSIDPAGGADIGAHAVYIKGYPYYYPTQDLSKRTHNISMDNFTFTNWSAANWNRVRVEGGDGITLSNFTFNDKDDTTHDFMIQGYNSVLEATYPELIKIQDVTNLIYEVRLATPVKISINYTDNSVFDITSEGSYPEGNRTIKYMPQYSSNLFWKYSGVDHRFEVEKYNITFAPITGYGNNITVNTNMVNDVSNITANVSEPTTVTITYLVDNSSNTYNLAVNNVFNTSAVSNSDSIVSFDYTFPSSTSTDFEVTWGSSTGWSAGCNIYVNHAVEVNTNGDITQKGSPDQGSVNLTGLFNVVVT